MISPLAALLRLHEKTAPNAEDGITPPGARETARLERSIDPKTLSRYRIACERYGAEAMVELDRNVCTGCNMRQPSRPRVLEEDILQCDSCGRIVYDPDAAYDFSSPAPR